MGDFSSYALVFDFDGPLFDGRKAATQALGLTFAKFSETIGRPAINFDGIPLLNPRRLIALFYAGMVKAKEQEAEVLDFYRGALSRIEREMKVDPDVEDMLGQLGTNFQLGVLSSRAGEELEDRLIHLGLSHYFQRKFGRDQVPKPKPDPAALEFVAAQLGTSFEKVVMVGDSDWDYLCTRRKDAPSANYFHAGWSGEPANRARTRCRAFLNHPLDLAKALIHHSDCKIQDSNHMPDGLREAVRAGDLVFYAGAGVSVPSGLGSWNDHYLPLLRKLGVSFLTENLELTEALQLVVADKARRKKLFESFRQSFKCDLLSPNAYHYAMMRSSARRVWTSNYDRLFEMANQRGGFSREEIHNDQKLLDNYRKPKMIIKMNGDFESASFDDAKLDWDLTFTQEQFDLVERERGEIWRLFEDDYRGRCIVFVGASLRDPALRRIMAVARQKIQSTHYQHYLLMKRGCDPLEEIELGLFAKSLSRQNIQVLFFDDHSDVQRMVTHLSRESYRPIVGFSGNFGTLIKPDWDMSQYEKVRLTEGVADARSVANLCKTIASCLARSDLRITSGCAPVVGIPAVSAAFKVNHRLARFYIREGGGSRYSRTAPAIVVDQGEGVDIYKPMRNRFIPELSLLIAMAGQIYAEKKSGTLKEIDMAMNLQIPVLLFPQAGGEVAKYHETFMHKIDAQYQDKTLATAIRQLNLEIAAITCENLTAFAANRLAGEIQKLLAFYMGSNLAYRLKDPKIKDTVQW